MLVQQSLFLILQKESLLNALKWKLDLDLKVHLKNGQKLPCVLVVNKYDLVEQNEKLSQFTDTELDKFVHKINLLDGFIVLLNWNECKTCV